VPVIDQSRGEEERRGELGYSVGVDAFGHVGFKVSIDGKFQEVITKDPLPLKKWQHIVATYEGKHGLSLYINGKLAGELAAQGPITPANGQDLIIGRVRQATLPLEWIHPKFAVWYSFDGIIDELQVYNRGLSNTEVAADFSKVHLPAADPLDFPKLPSGPPGPGRFGAYYADLKFEEMWDMPRRVGPDANVVVRFDQSPTRFVFWQGTSYVPAWVTENNKWYTDEFMETGGSPGCPLGEDCEPMSDKQNRYSHVRIIESNDARAIVHWRYGLCEVEQYICANPDPYTGWTDWADEYYTIYPDNVAVRLGTAWSSNLQKGREFQETIVINAPGTRPEDNINVDALSVSDMKGETQVFSWANPPKKGDKWPSANIQEVNLKSTWKPFQIVIPPGKSRPYTGEKTYSMFEWWNHWPVQQVKSSGISATAPDKTSHTSLSHFEGQILSKTDNSITKIMLHGLTQKPAAELVPLAKSWISPAKVEVKGDGFSSNGYDVTQRAFVFTRSNGTSALRATLQATADSPAIHPALLVKNWGEGTPRLKVDGKSVAWGPNYRFGHEHSLDGTNLIVWMNVESTKPVTVEIQ
ncbi:MAG TPA: LamG domain-containing protein, partial [Terriglobales bacterium]|nr:LamG domain-containing protein [Terriglobales bacterium]